MANRRESHLHPFVEAHLNEPGYYVDKLRALPEPREPATEAMLLLGESLGRSPAVEGAIEAAQAVRPEDTAPELYFMLLLVWEMASRGVGRMEESRALIDRARTMADSLSHPGLRAELLSSLASHTRIVLGDHLASGELMNRAIETSPRGSPLAARLRLQRAMRLAEVGHHQAISSEVSDCFGSGNERLLFVLHLVLYSETAQLAKAEQARKELSGRALPLPILKDRIDHYSSMVKLMRGRWALGRARSGSRDLPEWARTTDLLLRGEKSSALEAARQETARNAGLVLGEGYYSAFNLLRARLCCGDASGARRILGMRRRRGNLHYLDDLFLARVELLTGNREKAARHFAAVLAACSRHHAQGRLDFELRMACELSPTGLMGLTRRALSIDGKTHVIKPAPQNAPEEPRGLDRLVGSGSAAAAVTEAILRYAPLDVPVLITGETGTGKELVAQALHDCSPRAVGPFVAVNCGAIAESLLESELFGHVRGAFTGAEREQPGIFRAAGAGTVLLDEIGETPPRLQVALLRVLETGEVRPVGGGQTERIGCRILTATNAPLGARAEAGSFRKDLYYRLQRAEIGLLPLRERAEEVLPLVDYFLKKDREDRRRPIVSEALKRRLLDHSWPGNVRELRNAVEKMRLLHSDKSDYDLPDLEDVLPASGFGPSPESGESLLPLDFSPPGRKEEIEVVALLREGRTPLRRLDRLRELFRAHGRLTRAEVARILKTSTRTATRDLKVLCADRFIKRVEPTASPRTHYFARRDPMTEALPKT
jgi:DNA-binding NtrC family response regulator